MDSVAASGQRASPRVLTVSVKVRSRPSRDLGGPLQSSTCFIECWVVVLRLAKKMMTVMKQASIRIVFGLVVLESGYPPNISL